MRTTSKNKLLTLLAFVMVFSMIVCAMSITAFADDAAGDTTGDDTTGDDTTGDDSTGDDHDHDHENEDEDKLGWVDIVGYCVAGVLAVAMIAFIIWWIPKESDKKGKKSKK